MVNFRCPLSKIVILLFLFIWKSPDVYSQNHILEDEAGHTVPDSVALLKQEQDSLKIQELMMQVQELKLNEILLLSEKDHRWKADSLKKAEQKRQIDSLRSIIKGVPVIVEGDTLFSLYARRGGVMPSDRAEKTRGMILSLGKKLTIRPDSVYIFDSEFVTDIMSGDKVIITFTDQDGLWHNSTREELAKEYLPVISQKISELHDKYGLQEKIKNTAFFIGVILLQIILIYFTNRLFKRARMYINRLAKTKLRPISIKDYEFLNIYKQERILVFATNIIKYVFILIQLIISISILFSIFPETEKYAYVIFSYIWNPAKDILVSVLKFIPSVFKILLIYLCFRYIIKGLKYIANEIAIEKLKINGFYADWAFPTYYILRFLLYSFMIVMIWPLLPNSRSPIFQGVSVFIGLIISLGSTTVIGNLMAGLVITYMRPFKIGDQIQLNETVGNVIEKTPFVTRIRTSKNEVITIPNSFILSSQTVNYSASARDYGIIIHSDISIGYEVPLKQVQELLVESAIATEGIMDTPRPFVLVKELADFYCLYQINAYTNQDLSMPKIYSDLHKSIIDKFNEAGIEIMSPHFYARRDGNQVMMPPEYKKDGK
ncbi:MAG: mechanosensitive ion channel family protein [Dysgonamonadaceae bacterium]|jgi:small-conductance mechanosensitive channel|nr:mechanosensitive ion channel family protein [Dysgonamonadaceae bacterium]